MTLPNAVGATPAVETPDAPRSALRAASIVWLVALVPGGLFTLLIAGFALSPVQCPATGGSVLCRQASVTSIGLAIVAGLLLSALIAAIGSVTSSTKTRKLRLLGLSLVLAAAGPTVVALGAASWS